MRKLNPVLILFFVLTSVAFPFLSCEKKAETATTTPFECVSSPVAKSGRQFGMDILNQSSSGSYAADLSQLKTMKGEFQTLHLTWSSLEGVGAGSTSGAFTDPSNALQAFSAIAASDGIKLALTIRPIDATGKTVPSDLASTRFSNAQLKTRFRALVDFVLTQIPQSRLSSIMIGNEIDNYNPGADTNFWTDYGDFLNDIRTHVNTTYPGLPVGFTSTFEGVTNSGKTLALGFNSVAVMQAYAGFVDAVGVTYYPLNADFTVHAPSVVAADFNALVAFTAKPIHIQEIGYPTGLANNSTDDLQAEFYCEAFKAWDTHSTRIPQMAALRMNDVSRSQAVALAGPYGIATEGFIEYLRTLGLNAYSGSAKASLQVISSELSKRGF